MTLFVQLDVEYMSDPKILRAGAMAELVYLRSLTLAKRLLSDGRIDQAHLPLLALGVPGKPTKHAEALVDADLWEVVEGGWTIVAWGKRNRSRAEIEAKRQAKVDAGIKGNHDRWHSQKPSQDCPLCIAKGSQVRSQPDNGANPNGSPEPEPEPYPKPEPEPSNGSSSSASTRASCFVDEETVAAVLERYADLQHQRTGGPRSNPAAWRSTVIAQARTDHLERIRTWLDTFDVTPDRIAAALVDGRAPADWNHHRKASAS